MLLPEDRGYLEAEGMEKTYKFTQEQLKQEIDITTAQKVVPPCFLRQTDDGFVGQTAYGRDLSWISMTLGRMSSIIPEMDDIYWLRGGRDI